MLRGVFREIIHLSTKLRAEDRTQYTETDGEEEERLGLVAEGANTKKEKKIREEKKEDTVRRQKSD